MKRKWITAAVVFSLVALAVGWAAPQEKPAYTRQEYDAYTAASNEKNPQQRVRLLDDFVAKFPDSSLLPYAYQTYYTTHNELKNYPKVVEYADKLLSYGDKIDLGTKLTAHYQRALAFQYAYTEKSLNVPQQLTRTREAAQEGLKVLDQLPKPANMTEEQFAKQKEAPAAIFAHTAGLAALQLKDYKAAVDSFQGALKRNPNDGLTYYRLGLAYLQQDPPQHIDGFWAMARAVALKVPGEAQVRDYLRRQLLRYQLTGCEKLIDSQMNELISLAGTSADRPAGYNIPSAADLDKARQESNIVSILADLKGGAERAKLVWLATCGSEFPGLAGKVIEVAQGNDSIVLKMFTGATQEETEAATTSNMAVKVVGQPEAKRLKKDDWVRYSGTLAGYDPEPFMLHWENAKVNPEDLPAEEKPQPGKRPAKRPGKRPGP